MNGEEVDSVEDIKFLGIHITNDLTWSLNTFHLVEKAQQRLFLLGKFKHTKLPSQLLVSFYRSTIESILCHWTTEWCPSCTVENRKDLVWVVTSAQRIVEKELPAVDTMYAS